MPTIDMSVLMQAVMIAVLIWFGRKVQDMAETVAVHGEKHKRHDERFNQLEGLRHAAK